MRRRVCAAIAGIILIATAVLAFSLGKHPVIVGTNTAAPLLPALPIQSGETRCQTVSRVPAGASHVRVVASEISGPPGRLQVSIRGPEGRATTGGRRRVLPAGQVIRLKSATKSLHPARICLRYSGQGQIVLAGEKKRVPSRRLGGGTEKRGVASVVFLRPGLASWASRRDLIADRYANSQASPFGHWTLWLAVLAAIGATLLSLWWVVFRLEPRGGES